MTFGRFSGAADYYANQELSHGNEPGAVQQGLSTQQFEDLYGSEHLCEQAVLAWRWPDEFCCPRCGAGQRTEFRRGTLMYLQCAACQYQCSLIADTLFASTKLALKKWFLALHLLTKSKTNVPALELMRDPQVSYRSAWLVKHKLMEAMRMREEDRQLSGRVEIDAPDFGGKRTGCKSGRGSENKVPFVAAVQTTEGGQAVRLCLSLRPFTNESMSEFAARSLALPLTVVSGGLPCFAAVAAPGSVHDRNIPAGGKAAAKHPKFRAVYTVLGNLKTALSGTYKAFDFPKYWLRYLAEFQYRFNRRFNLRAALRRLATAVIRCGPRPGRVILAAEVVA